MFDNLVSFMLSAHFVKYQLTSSFKGKMDTLHGAVENQKVLLVIELDSSRLECSDQGVPET